MLSLRIERQGAKFSEDVLDDCQHADFFFSNGYIASCYHNEECMITEYYQNPLDPKIFGEVKEKFYNFFLKSCRIFFSDDPPTPPMVRGALRYSSAKK